MSRRGSGPPDRSFTSSIQQRGTVTARYMKAGKGKSWAAHGRYVERESAAGESVGTEKERFGLAKDEKMNETLGRWQKEGDERLWKVIVSPEHGEDVDFDTLAKKFMEDLENDVASDLEWTGVVHRNTDHPHLHLAIRGVRQDGRPLTFTRQQIKHEMRSHVRKELTRQLGYRSDREIQAAQERETENQRVTGIDRGMAARLDKSVTNGLQSIEPMSRLEKQRLKNLEQLKLAKREDGQWKIESDFIKQLNNIQILRERGRALFRNGAAISDEKLSTEILGKLRRLVGRVLLNSEEEISGRMQTAFETLDGKVTFIRHDPTLSGAWGRGDLQPGNVVVVDNLKSDPERLYAAALGKDVELLKDRQLLGKVVERLRRQGLMPKEAPTDKGWIGKFFRSVQALDRDRGMEL